MVLPMVMLLSALWLSAKLQKELSGLWLTIKSDRQSTLGCRSRTSLSVPQVRPLVPMWLQLITRRCSLVPLVPSALPLVTMLLTSAHPLYREVMLLSIIVVIPRNGVVVMSSSLRGVVARWLPVLVQVTTFIRNIVTFIRTPNP